MFQAGSGVFTALVRIPPQRSVLVLFALTSSPLSELHRAPLRAIADTAKSVHLRAYYHSSRLPLYPTVHPRRLASIFDLRSDSTAGTAALEFRELTSSAMQIARYFMIFLAAKKMALSSLLPPPKRGNDSTASRQLSKVKQEHRFPSA